MRKEKWQNSHIPLRSWQSLNIYSQHNKTWVPLSLSFQHSSSEAGRKNGLHSWRFTNPLSSYTQRSRPALGTISPYILGLPSASGFTAGEKIRNLSPFKESTREAGYDDMKCVPFVSRKLLILLCVVDKSLRYCSSVCVCVCLHARVFVHTTHGRERTSFWERPERHGNTVYEANVDMIKTRYHLQEAGFISWGPLPSNCGC